LTSLSFAACSSDNTGTPGGPDTGADSTMPEAGGGETGATDASDGSVVTEAGEASIVEAGEASVVEAGEASTADSATEASPSEAGEASTPDAAAEAEATDGGDAGAAMDAADSGG
jgi:hypothetical protein